MIIIDDAPTTERTRLDGALRDTRRAVDSLRLVLAGTDGRVVAAADDGHDQALAAMAASTIQMAMRLGEALGDAPLDELTVRTADGYAVLYPVGELWLLIALAPATTTLARLHLLLRDLSGRLATELPEQEAADQTPATPVTPHR